MAFILAAGLLLRLALAFGTVGHPYDIESVTIVAERFAQSPMDLYETGRWPYLPTYAAYAYLARGLAHVTGLPFHGLIQVPPIVADACLTALVAWGIGRLGGTDRQQIAGASLVAFGPAFVIASGYHGQIDSLAILPGVAACLLWRQQVRRRSLWSGLLIGLGIAFKTIPGFLLVALLPTARSVREAVRLVAFAALLPAAVILPYLATSPSRVRSALGYSGFPGLGGLSVVVQPHLVDAWLLEGRRWSPTPLTLTMWRWTPVIVGVALLFVLVALIAWRTAPVDAAVLTVLAIYVFSWSFFLQYAVWGLPFFLLIRRLRESLWMQVAVSVPTVLYYLGPWQTVWVADVYKVFMIGLWIGLAIAFSMFAKRLWSARRSPEPGAVRAAIGDPA